MNVLLLAPQPFYTERGTPIAVDLLLRALSERGDRVDLLTYHVGADVSYPGVRIFRIGKPLFVKTVSPGFSLKKVICDLAMWPKAVAMMREKQYDVVHAVEESVFIAMRLQRKFGVPYIYDMDSSLAQQMADKSALFSLVAPLLRYAECSAIRRSCAAVPVCDALADLAQRSGAPRVVTLRDISLLDVCKPSEGCNPRKEFGIEGLCLVYLGNMESYQGIDLLLQSFALFLKTGHTADLAIIGGTPEHVANYRGLAQRLGIGDRVHFAGPKPLSAMRSIFETADVLVSPRIKGSNTPMKIYSYMDSGKPILATRLPTHTQVMDDNTAMLAEPAPATWAAAMGKLADDPELRRLLGAAAKAVATEKYSYRTYKMTVDALYDGLHRTSQR